MVFSNQVYIVPPLPRQTPYWYRRYFSSISSRFAESFKHTEEGIIVLPTFPHPEYERDGIHLTEEDGPRFKQFGFYLTMI